MTTDAAKRALAENPTWYHTIELAPGVVTPGYVDLRRTAADVLPHDLRGARAVDVGTFDGFWSFEMERRGASVIAIDVDQIDSAEWPPHNRERLQREAAEHQVELGRGFRLAREALGSSVERRVCPVYELSPDRVDGPVDLVFLGALLLHLRDPVRALEAIRRTLASGGQLLMFEPFTMRQSLMQPRKPVAEFQPTTTVFNWWYPNIAGLRAMLHVAGFSQVQRGAIRYIRGEATMRQWCVAFSARPPG